MRIIAGGEGNLPEKFRVSGTFHSRLMGRHMSYASCDLETLTLDLGGPGAYRWYGSSCTICLSSLNFEGLPVRKIWYTFDFSINRPGDHDLWSLTLKLVRIIARWQSTCQLWCFCDFSFSTYGLTHVRRTTWHRDLDLWPWMSVTAFVGDVFVLHLSTKFEGGYDTFSVTTL